MVAYIDNDDFFKEYEKTLSDLKFNQQSVTVIPSDYVNKSDRGTTNTAEDFSMGITNRLTPPVSIVCTSPHSICGISSTDERPIHPPPPVPPYPLQVDKPKNRRKEPSIDRFGAVSRPLTSFEEKKAEIFGPKEEIFKLENPKRGYKLTKKFLLFLSATIIGCFAENIVNYFIDMFFKFN